METVTDLFEDLFDNPGLYPVQLHNALKPILKEFDNDYRNLAKALNECHKIGYHFEYDLDGQAFNLREINENDLFVTNYKTGLKDVPIAQVYPDCEIDYNHKLEFVEINGTIYNVWNGEIPTLSNPDKAWNELNHFVLKPQLND